MESIETSSGNRSLNVRFRVYSIIWLIGTLIAALPLLMEYKARGWDILLVTYCSSAVILTALRRNIALSIVKSLLGLLALATSVLIALFGTLVLQRYLVFALVLLILFAIPAIMFISDPDIRTELGRPTEPDERSRLLWKTGLKTIGSMILTVLLLNIGFMVALDGLDSFKIRSRKIPVIHIDPGTTNTEFETVRRQFIHHSVELPDENRILGYLEVEPILDGHRDIDLIIQLDEECRLALSNGVETSIATLVLGYVHLFGPDGPLDSFSQWMKWAVTDRLALLSYFSRRLSTSGGRELRWIETPGFSGFADYLEGGKNNSIDVVLFAKSGNARLNFYVFSRTLDKEALLKRLMPIIASLSSDVSIEYSMRLREAWDLATGIAVRGYGDHLIAYGFVEGPMPESVKDNISLARQDLEAGRIEDAKWRLIEPIYWQYQPAMCNWVLGEAFIAEGEAYRATYYLKQALKQYPDDPELKALLDIAIADKKRKFKE